VKPVKIIIADDHQLVLDGLKALIKDVPEFELIAEANNGQEVLDMLKNITVDVVLIDIDMPVLNGIETTRKLTETYPKVKMLALTMHNEKAMINTMLEAGASGYILKNADREELVGAIKKVAAGQQYFSSDVTLALLSKQSNKPSSAAIAIEPLIPLTQRETEILKLIAEGLSNTQIGEKLYISPRTVDTHRTNLMRKLNVSNIAGLIRYAINNGLVD